VVAGNMKPMDAPLQKRTGRAGTALDANDRRSGPLVVEVFSAKGLTPPKVVAITNFRDV
jgi:hypothetical protein